MAIETIGQRVRRLRLAAGIRFQKDLARQVGIDPASLNQIEQGYRVPKLATIDKLARALSTTRDTIIDGAPAARTAPPPAVESAPEAASQKPTTNTKRPYDRPVTRDEPPPVVLGADLFALVRSTIQEEIRAAIVDLGFAIAHSARPRSAAAAERKGNGSATHNRRTSHA